MWNGLSLWSDALSSWSAMAQTASKLNAMAGASAYVVDHRSRLIADAVRDPMNGDYAELSLMFPEKIAAFSKAGLAGIQAMGALHADNMALWHKMATLALAGKAMSPGEGIALARQSARASRRAAGATGRIIAPVHKGAVANAKRLRKKKQS